MTVTQTLAGLIGLYFLAAGIGILSDRTYVSDLMKDLIDRPAFGFLGGIIAFVIGGTIISIHNDWTTLLSGCVTLIGWASLAEGVLMLAFPRRFLSLFSGWAAASKLVTIFGLFAAAAGVGLIAAAFAG